MGETYTIQRGILDNAKRRLEITPDAIRFESHNKVGQTYTTFAADDITDFRCGITWHIFRGLVFGREYEIFVRNRRKEVMKINFNAYFGRKKKERLDLYYQILNSIWKHHFVRITEDFIAEFESGETFRIGDLILHSDGVLLKKNDQQLLPWADVQTRDYATYFSIYSKKNPADINYGFSYQLDWNTEVLKRVVEYAIGK